MLKREPLGVAVDSSDSPLGRWVVARWSPLPDSQLCRLVERIWYFEGTLTLAKERAFPDGRAELIVMLDEPHRDGDAAALPAFPAVCINGLRTRPSVVVAPPGRCRVVGISLEPQGACALIGAPVRQLLDVTVDLRDTLGAASHELGTRCALAAQTSSWNPERNAVAVVSEAAQWALRRIERGLDVDAVVHRAERIIRQQRGVVSVDALGTALGLSRPRFAQRFRERIGVTPKRFARMVRFHSALEMLGRSSSIALTASELAYYDQAHMHRDFEEFAGMTPGAFLQARRYGESASLAEP